MSVRPFSPSESFSFPRPPTSERNTSDKNSGDWGSIFSGRQSTVVSADNGNGRSLTAIPPSPTTPLTPSANPFSDPSTIPFPAPAFEEVETVKRPFVPTLQDELVVFVGDRVKVVQTFDDGWALVLKLPPQQDRKGKAKAVGENEQGLIPIDCLRDAHQELPAFLAQKRVSSYVESDAGTVTGH
ncbi:hypothetical protein AMATHDRAFT_157244 [Amanita thiersii Skay4041]|uniref:SH3 domain-containing protein n=1 Tax=Amanita thiersii Skay4041 TaxID=703135 RepID=A0A2A9NDW7_9AGAR|nr:hypothetical protein AMATHDRAFT_157244 [Amanita thiersii Skay4041]